MGAAAFLVTLVLARGPLAELVPAEATAYLEVPDLDGALVRLSHSPLSPLGAALAPKRLREALWREPEASLLFVLERRDATLDASLLVEAGAAAADVLALLREASGAGLLPRAVFVAARDGRVEASTHEAALARGAAKSPLAAQRDFVRLATRQADVRSRLDVQRWFGALARRPGSAVLAGAIDRLGLMEVQALEVTGALEQGGARFALAASRTGAAKGLFAALGPPLVGSDPTLGKGAVGVVAFAVHPVALYHLALILGVYFAPIETTLLRSALGAIEERLGRRLDEHVLGAAPRVWSCSVLAGGELVLVAPLADAPGLAPYLEALRAQLPMLGPGLELRRGSAAGVVTFTLHGGGRELVSLGLGAAALVVAPSARLLRDALALPVAQPPGELTLAARGRGDLPRAVLTSLGVWSRLVAAARLEKTSEAALARALAGSRLGAVVDASGVRADLVIGP